MKVVGKKGGRIAGTPNKVTSKLREQITDILNGYFDKLDFDKLEEQNKISLIGKLLPFVLPKLANIQVNQEQETKPFNVIYLGEGIDPQKDVK